MKDVFIRTQSLLGERAMEKLGAARVAVFGIGGVGSYALEGLLRSGVGKFVLVDGDVVSVSNCNRQLVADLSTVGKKKTEVAAARVLAVNPDAEIVQVSAFYGEENQDVVDFAACDYVVDAVDDVAAKTLIVQKANAAGVAVISCMGTGNKLDPSRLQVADISKTHTCPLAKSVRKIWKEKGIQDVKVVFSDELPLAVRSPLAEGKKSVGSVAFVPSVAGLLIAAEVVKDIVGESK